MNIVNGSKFIPGSEYIEDIKEKKLEKTRIMNLFNESVKIDSYSGNRKRAYIKVELNILNGSMKIAKNQHYFQSSKSNNLDGGKKRYFPSINPRLVDMMFFKNLVKQNKTYIDKYCELSGIKKTTLGIHFVRYEACPDTISFSSPIWLHIDDEPLVFVHLLELTKNSIGGDNIISKEDNELTSIIRLEDFMDTIILDRTVKHAVTPLGSKNGTSYRDIILLTLEDNEQNEVSLNKYVE